MEKNTSENVTEKAPKKRGRPENFVKLNANRTPEERREAASKAGKASGKARQGYRTQRELLKQILTAAVDDKDLAAQLEANGFPATFGGAVALAAARRATQGDIEAARYVRDTMGEKPTEAYQVAVTDKPIKAMDLTQMTDEELAELADMAEDGE